MSDLTRVLKQNKAVKSNTFYAPTKSLQDEKGEPLKWEIKPLTTKENEIIRDKCTKEVPVAGKPNMFRPRVDAGKFGVKMIVTSVVYPNLYNVELQDSYGVKTPEDLVFEMINDPGEYNDFVAFVQNFNGFNTSLEDKVDKAKN